MLPHIAPLFMCMLFTLYAYVTSIYLNVSFLSVLRMFPPCFPTVIHPISPYYSLRSLTLAYAHRFPPPPSPTPSFRPFPAVLSSPSCCFYLSFFTLFFRFFIFTYCSVLLLSSLSFFFLAFISFACLFPSYSSFLLLFPSSFSLLPCLHILCIPLPSYSLSLPLSFHSSLLSPTPFSRFFPFSYTLLYI